MRVCNIIYLCRQQILKNSFSGGEHLEITVPFAECHEVLTCLIPSQETSTKLPSWLKIDEWKLRAGKYLKEMETLKITRKFTHGSEEFTT